MLTKYLLVFLVSMVPLIELRGAVPIALGMDLPVLEAIVGHLDRETTRIYTHLRADDLVEAVQGMKKTKNLQIKHNACG